MVRQYRNALERYTLEIPAGALDEEGEPGFKCAARELEEETGYKSEELEWLITLRTTVAFCNEKIEVYVAKNLIPSKQHLDEDEFIDLKAYSLDELKEKNIAISRGTVIDYATDLLCEKYGIKSGEINKPEIAQIPLRLNMLQYGQIEATFLPDPFATIAMKNGNKSLISTRELNIHLTGTAFTETALKEKRKEITALIKGYNLGVKHIQACSPKELNLLLTEAAGIPDYIAKLILLPSYTPAKRPDEQDIRQTIKWLRNKNKIPDNYQGENLIDTTFLPRTMNTSANRHAKR